MKDIWGNDVTYGPNGEKYIHEKDIFGSDITYGPDGKKIVHTKDIFDNNVSVTSGGEKHIHGKDIFGNDVTYGPNGEQYVHGKDIFGNDVICGPESKKDELERGRLNFEFSFPNISPDLYGVISAYAPEKRNIPRMYESAESKHNSGYSSKRKDSLQRGEKIILDIINYNNSRDYDKHSQYADELRKYDGEDFTAMKTRIEPLLRFISANKPTAGYIRGKGWPLARRYHLWTYYPDKDRHTNVDDIKEVIYFLKEDGTFAVYTYADEYSRYYSGGESHSCQNEDIVLQDCSMETVMKALDFDFYAYERSDWDYHGKDQEWIQSGTILGEFGSGWRGARQLAIRKYPQKGMGLVRVLSALKGDSNGDFQESAQAYAAFCQIVKIFQARKLEKQKKEILAAKARERAEMERERVKRAEKRKEKTKRAYRAGITFHILFYVVTFLSAGRGENWIIFAGCALTGAFIYSYLDGLHKPYSYRSPFFSAFLYVVFGTACLLGLVFFFVDPSGALHGNVVSIFYIMTVVLISGQIITFIIGSKTGKRVSPPNGATPQHSGTMADIYIVYIMMALITVFCVFAFVPKISEGIRFWQLLSG